MAKKKHRLISVVPSIKVVPESSGMTAKITVSATFTPPTVAISNPSPPTPVKPMLPTTPTAQLKTKKTTATTWNLIGSPQPMNSTGSGQYSYTIDFHSAIQSGYIFGADVLGTWVVNASIPDPGSASQ